MAQPIERAVSADESCVSLGDDIQRAQQTKIMEESTVSLSNMVFTSAQNCMDETRYECAICLNWLNEPMLTSCGHRFCRICITDWLKKQQHKSCPIDQKPLTIEDIFPDNYTRREIFQLRKSCPFASSGCRVILSPLELDSHALICSFKKEELSFVCSFKKCGCKFEGKDDESLKDHIDKNYREHLNLLLNTFTSNQTHLQKSYWDAEKTSNGNCSKEPTQDSIQNLVHSMYERIVVLEQTNREKNAKIENLSDRLLKTEDRLQKSRFYHGELVWKIEGFLQKIEMMRLNPNIMFYSCEAFTSSNGYKFCGRFNLSPKCRDAISLHVHLMRSENDYHLSYPFVGKIKFSMINSKNVLDSQHDTIMSKPEILAFHRPREEISPRGFGFMEFAYIQDLKRGFIFEDDSLTIKIQMNIV